MLLDRAQEEMSIACGKDEHLQCEILLDSELDLQIVLADQVI